MTSQYIRRHALRRTGICTKVLNTAESKLYTQLVESYKKVWLHSWKVYHIDGSDLRLDIGARYGAEELTAHLNQLIRFDTLHLKLCE